jgi:hypothetical protein
MTVPPASSVLSLTKTARAERHGLALALPESFKVRRLVRLALRLASEDDRGP